MEDLMKEYHVLLSNLADVISELKTRYGVDIDDCKRTIDGKKRVQVFEGIEEIADVLNVPPTFVDRQYCDEYSKEKQVTVDDIVYFEIYKMEEVER